MTRYLVATPSYETLEGGMYDPPEYGADVEEVEADTPANAKAEAVRRWRIKGPLRYCYDKNPFKGLEVIDIEELEEEAISDYQQLGEAGSDGEAGYWLHPASVHPQLPVL